MHSRIVPPTFTKQLSCIRGQNRPESQALGWVCAGGWRGLRKADQLGPGWLLELQPAEAQSPVALLGPWPGLGGCGLVALGTYLSLRLWWVEELFPQGTKALPGHRPLWPCFHALHRPHSVSRAGWGGRWAGSLPGSQAPFQHSCPALSLKVRPPHQLHGGLHHPQPPEQDLLGQQVALGQDRTP